MASFKLIYLFTLVSLINFLITNAQDDHGFLGSACSGNDTTTNSGFQLNVRTLLSYLSSNTTANKPFYNTTVASRNHSDTVYGMFVCWGNVPPHLCTQCVANATETIFSNSDSHSLCSLSKEAVFWYEDCMIRFSNNSFFSTIDLRSDWTQGSCISTSVSNNQTNLMSLFSKTINQAADEAANSAIGAKKYATKQARISGFKTLYCEVQCTPDLSPQNCRKCLNFAIADVQKNCEGSEVGSFANPSCNLRCDVYPFYRPSTAPAPKELIPIANSSSTGLQYSQDATYLFHGCSSNETTSSTFLSNLRTLLSSLYSNSTTKTSFYKATVDTVSGHFMCRGDLSLTLCQVCVLNATQRITSECPSSKEAIIWYDHCLLRYWEGSSVSTLDTTPTYHDFNILNTSNPSQQQSFFTWILVNTLSELKTVTDDDSIIKNYVTRAVKLNDHQKLYTLAQCTPDLSNADCGGCLDSIFEKEIPWCCMGSPEGKVLYPTCYIMFGLSQFYRDEHQVDAYRPAIAAPPPATTAENNTGKSQTIILIVVPTIISLALLYFCCYLRRRKARKRSHKILLRKNFGHESITLEGLQFDSTVIKAATNNFSHENKIGKGGFGEVYKGILYDGRHVAIKRLSTFSKQSSDEFKNEILLIAKLQHRNLVTFIGFCLEEQEKILIYEFMPNGSLDYALFDNTPQQKLNWSERYKIIKGTALGIHYLHEYSRLKIIHRDLKPNNILLDENMNPKISDFGMARIVEIDQDCGNTNQIVGTYGYMSPEYAMFGQFSEKSDVFSFGVMVLEIITGKRNTNIYESFNIGGEGGLVDYVWRQWKDEEPLIVLDSNIKESYSQTEVFKCIHIGLLCVQENPNVRPTMATIISYLNNLSLELPSPQEPVFFLHRRKMDHQEIVRQRESSSSGETVNGSTLFSTNEMSTSDFYPR